MNDTNHRLDRSSKARLTPPMAERFPGETLFARLARTLCQAGCLPRKELFEAWEVARRVRRHFRGGTIVDAPAGHGLLAWVLLLLDDTSPSARCIDRRRPSSAERIAAVLTERWPRLDGRVHYDEHPLETTELPDGALLVSVHACGALTDRALDLAIARRTRVAVLPCCHDLALCDSGDLQGWVDGPLAIDITRAQRLRAAGFRVRTLHIPDDITPQNRLLLADPR